MNESTLKAQVRELEAKSQRAGVDIEYVKNVLVKYMELGVSAGQKNMVPLIGGILEFTPDDIRRVHLAVPLQPP